MPNDNRNLPAAPEARAPKRSIAEATSRMIGFIEQRGDQVATLVGGKKEYEKFKQVVSMALHKTPELLDCDPKSFVDSCLICATDGLVPDGRRAALTFFNDNKTGKKIVNYLPMIRGVIECLYRTGLVKSHQVDVVYEGEPFVYRKGLNGCLDHEPVDTLRTDDSKIVWAYALIETIAGGVFYTAMTRSEIDKIRAIAKTNKVWGPFFAEMAKKTVMRNLSKSLPFDLEVTRRDDVLYDLDRANAPAMPAQRQVTLLANPDDRITDDDDDEQDGNDERLTKTGAVDETAEKSTGKPQDGDDAPQATDKAKRQRKAPEKAAGAQQEASGDDRKPSLSEAAQKLRQWVMDQITKVKTGDDLDKAMGLAWEHAAWPELESAGLHKPLYQIIVVTEAFAWLDANSETAVRIKKG